MNVRNKKRECKKEGAVSRGDRDYLNVIKRSRTWTEPIQERYPNILAPDYTQNPSGCLKLQPEG